MAGVKAATGIVKSVATQSVKEGWKLAAKAIGISLAKGVGKEVVTQLVNYGVNQTLMPSIENAVILRVEGPIQQALLNNLMVERLLKIDEEQRNNYYQNLIKQKALEILHPRNEQENTLLTITKGIAAGIAKQKIEGLSTILQIADAIKALDELNEFVPKFIEQLNEIITIIHNGLPQENTENNNQISNQKDQQEQISDKHTTTHTSNTQGTALGSVNTSTNRSSQLKDIDLQPQEATQAQLQREAKTPAKLGETLSSNISKSMCFIIQSKLITPLSQAGISYGMTHLTADIDKGLQDEIGNYQAERRMQFMQSGDTDHRVPIEFKKFEDKETENKAIAKAEEVIKGLEEGGEAGLPHLGSLSDQAERPIEVYDEKGQLLYIIGEDKGGEPIKIEHHKNNDGSGHWTLPGGQEPSGGSSGKNNCLFDVIAAQTGQKGYELRQATVAHMSNNKELLAYQAADIARLEAYKSDALRLGGCTREQLKSSEVRFSQSSISEKTRDGTSIDALAASMGKNGFDPNKPAMDVVMMESENGSCAYVSLDNRRLAAAQAADVNIIANVYPSSEELSPDQKKRFGAETAGEAVKKRISEGSLTPTTQRTSHGIESKEVRIRTSILMPGFTNFIQSKSSRSNVNNFGRQEQDLR